MLLALKLTAAEAQVNRDVMQRKLQNFIDELAYALKCRHNLNMRRIEKETQFDETAVLDCNQLKVVLQEESELEISYDEVVEIVQGHLIPMLSHDLAIELSKADLQRVHAA